MSKSICLGLACSVIALATFSPLHGETQTITTKSGDIVEATKVLRVELDGISFRIPTGIVKIPFDQLPDEIQHKYNYNPEAAGAYARQRLRSEQQYKREVERAREQKEAEWLAAEAARNAKSDHVTRYQNDLDVMRKNMLRQTSYGAVRRLGDHILRPEDTAPYDAIRAKEEAKRKAVQAAERERIRAINSQMMAQMERESEREEQKRREANRVYNEYSNADGRNQQLRNEIRRLGGSSSINLNTRSSSASPSISDIESMEKQNRVLESEIRQRRGY